MERLSTGIEGLDERLGGGLLPGTLTVLYGATGIGKTQIGVRFAAADRASGTGGIFCDMSSRGDSQSHEAYARRLADWTISPVDPSRAPTTDELFDTDSPLGDFLAAFGYSGKRVNRAELGFEGWNDWHAELARRLHRTIAFFYGNFIRGSRRVVVDGIEPVAHAAESIQLELFEYVYHQILKKEPEWVARDLLREHYRENAEKVARYQYQPDDIGCMLLSTSRESMLEELISRQLEEGDLLAGANTIIYLGKIRDGLKMTRAMYIAKHRGSAQSDDIIPFDIDENGVRLV